MYCKVSERAIFWEWLKLQARFLHSLKNVLTALRRKTTALVISANNQKMTHVYIQLTKPSSGHSDVIGAKEEVR